MLGSRNVRQREHWERCAVAALGTEALCSGVLGSGSVGQRECQAGVLGSGSIGQQQCWAAGASGSRSIGENKGGAA